MDDQISPGASARGSLYSISGTPMAVWGGVNFVSGGSAQTAGQYSAQYNNIVVVPSPIELDIGYEITDNTISAYANVNMLENITTTNNRILFIVSYDFEGELYGDFFSKVVRYNEQNFGLTNLGESGIFTQEIILDPSWELHRLKLITLIQTFSGNRVIHQSQTINLDYHLPHLLAPRQLVGDYNDEIAPYSIDLSWQVPLYSNTTLLGYMVYRDNEAIHAEPLSPEITNLSDFNIAPATMYYYFVRAIYIDGESLPSNFVDIYTDKNVPTPVLGPPRNLQGYDQQDKFTKFILWEAPNYENTEFLLYRVYRNGKNIAELSNMNEIFFTDRNINESGYLTYYVTAVYTHAESKHSNYVQMYIEPEPNVPVLGEPKNLRGEYMPPSTVTAQGQGDGKKGSHNDGMWETKGGSDEPRGGSVTLTWEAPDYEHTIFLGYRIYRNNFAIAEIVDIDEMYFSEANIQEIGLLVYCVTAVYSDGESITSNIFEATNVVSDDDSTEVSYQTILVNNFPNPFNPATTIAFELAVDSIVSIDIFNVRGQRMKTLANEHFGVGFHSVEWNGTDDNGRSVGSGIYFYRMVSGDFTDVKRMVLLR
ncbi:MAG: T9SS type A sorting domain-containing protein [Candidatus Cloacimonetes bacterium]|nr:T9SS type A sorting domain-containing protein [Candidatus Cloacimonadota bacterium]